MKARQSRHLHNPNAGTTKPEHLHNNERAAKSKYLYYAGYIILAALTLFFCWLFCLRWGVFGAKVDWISQHSVIPDYFRKQFYATGKLFPEFAMNLGGGQNIYNYSYYGLYSPLFLLSYALPFMKMSTYVIVMEIVCLMASVLLLYLWLSHKGFGGAISFGTAFVFLLTVLQPDYVRQLYAIFNTGTFGRRPIFKKRTFWSFCRQYISYDYDQFLF